jgi:hypothetical protein
LLLNIENENKWIGSRLDRQIYEFFVLAIYLIHPTRDSINSIKKKTHFLDRVDRVGFAETHHLSHLTLNHLWGDD